MAQPDTEAEKQNEAMVQNINTQREGSVGQTKQKTEEEEALGGPGGDPSLWTRKLRLYCLFFHIFMPPSVKSENTEKQVKSLSSAAAVSSVSLSVVVAISCD